MELLYRTLPDPINDLFIRRCHREALKWLVHFDAIVFEEAIEQVGELDVLSDRQRAAVDAMVVMYHLDTARIHRGIIDAESRWADSRIGVDEMPYHQRSQELRDAINKRYDAEERYLEELRLLLDEEQQQLVQWPEFKRPDPSRAVR